ncbi:MAG: hypothetical protein AAF674_15455 [Pseudomonadota bacterium]
MRCAVLIFLMCFAPVAWAQQTIAVSEWVHPNAWQTPPSSATRATLDTFVALERDVSLGTDGRGAIDILFERGSRMLVGPACALVLDETLYDPRLDDVVSFEVNSDTVCVVRTGAGGETLVLETPIAIVTIEQASASISYLSSAQAALPAGPLSQAGPGTVQLTKSPGDPARLVVVFNGGLGVGQGSVTVEAKDNGRTAVLYRPGFSVRYLPGDGLSEPELAQPEDAQRIEAANIATDATARTASLVAAPTFAEVDRAIAERRDLGAPLAGACASGDFCDAATAGTDFGAAATFP